MRKKKPVDVGAPKVFDAQAERRSLLEETLRSIEMAEAGRRAPLIREARELISEIAGKPRAVVSEVEERGRVVNFQERLAKHRSASASAGGRLS